MSTELAGAIYSLIPKVMAEIGSIGKDRKNEQQGYKFRGIEDFYNAAHPAFVNHGIFCVPQVLEHESQDRLKTDGSGKISVRVVAKVSHKFFAHDGSFVDVITVGEGIDQSDKATNKAMSAAMKYALIELFMVPTKDVEDSDRSGEELGHKTRPVSSEGKPKVEPRTFSRNASPVARDAPTDLDPTGLAFAQPTEAPPADSARKDAEAFTEAVNELAGKKAMTSDPVNSELVELGQAVNFEITFRDALKPKYRKDSLSIAHAWLLKQKIVDKDGKPTAKALHKDSFFETRESAVTYAAEYQE